MSCIVYRTTSTGRKYAYSSESYWDKEKQQPRSKRTYLGWVDPETGEILKGRPAESKRRKSVKVAAEESQEITRLKAELEEKNAEILSLRAEIKSLNSRLNKLRSLCGKVSEMTKKASEEVS